MRRADAELDHLHAALHVAARIGERLAMLAADRLGQLVHVAVDQAHIFHHDARAFLRVDGRPFLLRLCRIRNGLIQLRDRGERRFRLHFAGGRIVDVGKAARHALDVLAIDVMRQFGGHEILQLHCGHHSLAKMGRTEAMSQIHLAFLQRTVPWSRNGTI